MKITQEVRDFAAKQNQTADAFLAANPPRDGEGDHSATPNGGGGSEPRTPVVSDLSSEALAKAEAGMAEMSKVFRESGSELYLGARNRERD